MDTALLIVDVQNDFCEGGALGVKGGSAVAAGITQYLRQHRGDYRLVVASRDWHRPGSNNGGHFSEPPDFVDTWPVHCVANSRGSEYSPLFDITLVDIHIYKGDGKPAYSAFEAVDDSGQRFAELLDDAGTRALDICGLATDYCVRFSGLDALARELVTRVLAPLCAGVHEDSSAATLTELEAEGTKIVRELD